MLIDDWLDSGPSSRYFQEQPKRVIIKYVVSHCSFYVSINAECELHLFFSNLSCT